MRGLSGRRIEVLQRMTHFAEFLLAPERLKTQGLFEPGFYWRYVKPHLEAKEDFTWQVWAALMFQLWYFVFIEQNARSAPTYTWRDIIN